ncbi:MAG TPA: trimeric intracellular cation channel family protein [Pelagibacterium sp.]|uniref:trimeric intracellular cation channel family protein n=1 Tax=Pelagibacterium sp. TaxID=1967288 RepID=UPI002B91A8ED|nr:trimeric intracellular cation channel family protein [Pelagibacterium sp.]HWJ89434.1 trimeric intracellular cation channel family protein [Pelagibacterium sp.]
MLLHTIFVIALAAEAMTAALAAGRRNMDWFGVCVLGCVTALGGGTTRDILLGHYPLIWVEEPGYLLVTIAAAMFTIAVARVMERLRLIFLLLDAVGLVVFTIVGCQIAMDMGQPAMIVIVAGLITGCVGGVLRDVLCNDVPLLFAGELYATVSAVTACIYFFGVKAGLPVDAVTVVAAVIGFAFRTLAIVFKLEMPRFVYAPVRGNQSSKR